MTTSTSAQRRLPAILQGVPARPLSPSQRFAQAMARRLAEEATRRRRT